MAHSSHNTYHTHDASSNLSIQVRLFTSFQVKYCLLPSFAVNSYCTLYTLSRLVVWMSIILSGCDAISTVSTHTTDALYQALSPAFAVAAASAAAFFFGGDVEFVSIHPMVHCSFCCRSQVE